jgi:hypothetical protein
MAVIAYAVTFAALPAVVAAQQDAGPSLTIQVTDFSGAPIPNAQIQIMSPEDGKLLTFKAYGEGVALLHLSPGVYQYRVAYPAFCARNGTAKIDSVWPLKIAAKLNVAACPGCLPCVTPNGLESTGGFSIRVIDPLGALVPGALVEVDSSSPAATTIKTDSNGQASIGLPLGTHFLRVRAVGFRLWKGFAEAQVTQEAITAELRVAGTADPEISIESPFEDFPLYIPQPPPIELQDLEILPLPGVAVSLHIGNSGRTHR